MKYFFLLLFIYTPFVPYAQSQTDCEQLAITLKGIVETDDSNQFLLEVSNAMYTGSLYYYPGFVLLNEQGDTVAKEKVQYYGIGNQFQIHLLDINTDISFPFTGTLELHGSYYQKRFCSFPIYIPKAISVTVDQVRNKPIKVSSTLSNKDIIIDLSALNIEAPNYQINISNDSGDEVYTAKAELSILTLPTSNLEGPGIYFLSIWDAYNKRLLPAQKIVVE